jgi:hypothetical protein
MRTNGLFASSGRALAVVAAALATGVSAQAPADLDTLLAHVGERVRQFYTRAESLVCTEKVVIQPLGSSLNPDGFGRSLEYELRVDWTPPTEDGGAPDAKVVRQLIKVNGRPPRARDEHNACMDPKPVSPEPLAMLLPHKQNDYRFSWPTGKRRDPKMLAFDYRAREIGKVEGTVDENCISISAPGYTKGRVWIDPETHDVLRLDEQLTGLLEYRLPARQRRTGMADTWVVERADSTIRYRPVTFRDPDETILLPESIESLTVFRGSSSHRIKQTFSNYRRFLTGGRIIK